MEARSLSAPGIGGAFTSIEAAIGDVLENADERDRALRHVVQLHEEWRRTDSAVNDEEVNEVLATLANAALHQPSDLNDTWHQCQTRLGAQTEPLVFAARNIVAGLFLLPEEHRAVRFAAHVDRIL